MADDAWPPSTTPMEPRHIEWSAYDSDAADAAYLTVANHTQPSHGFAYYDGTEFVYIADEGYSGTDSFTYTVTDGLGFSSPATINITVDPAPQREGENEPPSYGDPPLFSCPAPPNLLAAAASTSTAPGTAAGQVAGGTRPAASGVATPSGHKPASKSSAPVRYADGTLSLTS